MMPLGSHVRDLPQHPAAVFTPKRLQPLTRFIDQKFVSICGVQLHIIDLQLATLLVPECAQVLDERSITRGPLVDW
jgi:hypothetical protein